MAGSVVAGNTACNQSWVQSVWRAKRIEAAYIYIHKYIHTHTFVLPYIHTYSQGYVDPYRQANINTYIHHTHIHT